MAINFRLQANAGNDNDTLFPRIGASGVIGAENSYEIVTIEVTIPATQDDIQIITAPVDEKMANSSLRVYLKSVGEIAENDYSTISQLEVKQNQIIIDRLYTKPQGDITIQLVFFEKRGEV